jgi:hypothetical protein
MQDIVVARIMVKISLNSIEDMMCDLSEEDLDELEEELSEIYAKYDAKING